MNNKDNTMWIVQYKPNNDSQPWSSLGSYDNKVRAILHASRVSGKYFMVKVEDQDSSVIWSN
jgi:hypothetical protein